MEITRARRISNSFADSVSLKVSRFKKGLLVQHRQCLCYFTHESSFWAYIYSLAGLPVSDALNQKRSPEGLLFISTL